MTEFAPKGKRGLYGAWQSFTVALGLLAGAGVVALISAVLSPPEARCMTGAGASLLPRHTDGHRRAVATR